MIGELLVGVAVGALIGRLRSRARRAHEPRVERLLAVPPAPAWSFRDAVASGQVTWRGECGRCGAPCPLENGALISPACGGGAVCRELPLYRPPPPTSMPGPADRRR